MKYYPMNLLAFLFEPHFYPIFIGGLSLIEG